MDDTESYLNFRNIPFGNFSLFSNFYTPDINFLPVTGLRTIPLVSSLSVAHNVTFADHLIYQSEDINE
jgi:hypothetical protein